MAPSITIAVKDAPADVLTKRAALCDMLEANTNKAIEVFRDVSAPEYREMRRNGTNGFNKPPEISEAETIVVKRRGGTDMELRIIKPTTETSRGSMLHFHAGGLVYGTARGQDIYLQALANALGLTAVSVEYRLAPEHPFPASQHDATDAALYALSEVGVQRLGGPLRLLMGESSGAYLAVWTAISLRDDHGINVRDVLAGLLCSYGIYDMSFTPSLLRHQRNIIVGRESMLRLVDAAFPHEDEVDRKDASVSPLYADLKNLPPALFLCGAEDSVIDDSVFLGARWGLAGNRAEVKLVPHGFHAFSLIPTGEIQKEGVSDVISFGLSVL
ncbi:lipase esterase [Fusarium beomiforme]|uniref:Lipase esterase n=1 Tax=Fusarium beomiforme TaxID=44412 RepID=A0A9P5A887_9HYPO|nr:lipase esterase [Fusarium beomiforme]